MSVGQELAATRPHIPETLTDRLHTEKRELEDRLEQIDALLKQLDENPGVHIILDALAKLGHRLY